MQYFPSDLIKHNKPIKEPIIKHSQQASKESYLVLSRVSSIQNIVNKIEAGLIKGIISTNDCLTCFAPYKDKIELIECHKPSLFWAEICFKNYNQMPQNCIAVTGTSGKTSTTWFIYQLLIAMKQNVLLINSSGIFENGQKIAETINTTPDAQIIHQHANDFALKYKQDSFLVIEVSSIAIDQHRTAFIKPNIGVWINFSHEHLDYHKTLENYFQAKMKLSNQCEKFFAHESIDIKDNLSINKYGQELIDAKQNNELEMSFKFDHKLFNINANVFGNFQSNNILSAIIALKQFFDLEKIMPYIPPLKAPEGRMQLITYDGRKIFIDNAHKPDALKHALETLKNIATGKLLIIAGCGGQRDSAKRPIMGSIMQSLSDIAIITCDNPRNEDAQEIANQMLSGCIKTKQMPEIVLDRKQAIIKALAIMQPNDILLIAGKGEEKEQIFANNMIVEWNDYQAVKQILENAI